ncbi:hypothetical protein A0H81_04662 [Grifola frondosa]|uniref:Uncharacterized protein n=1 Tax=Grifola frondosa TaxID=5627 RepID=A0A1C7MFH1_GRIFR|nr:hypothetical protein A0H81_04662 [Grifola frondosa]
MKSLSTSKNPSPSGAPSAGIGWLKEDHREAEPVSEVSARSGGAKADYGGMLASKDDQVLSNLGFWCLVVLLPFTITGFKSLHSCENRTVTPIQSKEDSRVNIGSRIQAIPKACCPSLPYCFAIS